MKISRTVSYAVQAALHLAEAPSDSPVPCSRIAAEGHMPERFLLQILRNLVTHGILHSTRGVDGGYTLERAPDEISLLDVIEASDGPMATSIPASDGLAETSAERLRRALQQVTDQTRRQLGAVRLSQLMMPPRNEETPEKVL